MGPPRTFDVVVAHYEACLRRHGDNHRGVDWPDAEDARKRYRVMAEAIREKRGVDLLDFGCGAGHFLDYLRAEGRMDVDYRGLDISPAYVELCRRKYPGVAFDCVDILEEGAETPQADYVVMNGVFTERCGLAYETMFEAMTQILSGTFARARNGIAFNMMSKFVDWERDDLFHVPYERIAAFVTSRLSRHHVIRADYGLYEYTVYVYKDPR